MENELIKADRARPYPDGEMPKKPCIKCLIRDIPNEKELHRAIQELLEQMNPTEKAGSDVYEKRLSACSTCPFLNRGTCSKCGCYTELRCAKRRLSCPDVPPRWESEAIDTQ